MGSVQDDGLAQDGTTARLGVASSTAALQGNLEGQAVGFDDLTTDDAVSVDQVDVAPQEHAERQTGQHQVGTWIYQKVYFTKILRYFKI